jgi:hypothetical protein
MKKRFSWKVFISFGLAWSLFIILISGIVLYISPAGRFANWVNWNIAGFTKEEWASIHTVFSFAFVVLSIFHLFTVNWKAFWSYLKSKTRSGINKKAELIISSVLVILFFLGVAFSVPPLRYISDFGEYLALSWEKNEQAAPVSHAELLTISQLAGQTHFLTAEQIAQKLTASGIVFEDTDKQTLHEIAVKNHKTPEEIYSQVSGNPENGRPGAGMGRKTIETIAAESGLTVEEVLSTLIRNNIMAEKGQTIKQIGDNNNISPKDIMQILGK